MLHLWSLWSVSMFFLVFRPVKGFCNLFDDECPVGSECCWRADGSFECCSSQDHFQRSYEENVSVGKLAVIGIIISGSVISLCLLCVCCLCCSCCPFYKGRRRGTVYGRMQTTAVTTAQQAGQATTAELGTHYRNTQGQQMNLPYPVQPPAASVQAVAFNYPGYMPMPQPPGVQTTSIGGTQQANQPPPAGFVTSHQNVQWQQQQVNLPYPAPSVPSGNVPVPQPQGADLPPQYSEVFGKQAPYNPTYQQ